MTRSKTKKRKAKAKMETAGYPEALEEQTLEQQLAEGYIANEQLNREISEEFTHVDNAPF
jgi:hypothetical protein